MSSEKGTVRLDYHIGRHYVTNIICAELHYTFNIEVSELYIVIVMTEILGTFIVSDETLADGCKCRLSLFIAPVLLAHSGCLNLLLSQHT